MTTNLNTWLMRSLGCLVFAAVAAVTPLSAANGDIPIYQATTITQPGRYIVTRDISAQGDVIVIQAGGVTLDLNGHTITSLSGSGIVFDLFGIVAPCDLVANGRIVAAVSGIRALNLPAVMPVIVDRVGIIGPSSDCIDLPAVSMLTVRNSWLRNCGRDGIRMTGNGTGVLEVEDTVITDIRGSGIFADAVDGVTVRESTIRRFGVDPGVYGQAGVWILSPGKIGLSVLDSVLADGSTMGTGLRLWLMGHTGPNRIVGNQIGGNLGYGIDLVGGPAHITGNTIAANAVGGIRVEAAGIVTPTMISGNSLLDNGVHGAEFLAGVVRFNGNTVGGNHQDGVSVAGERTLVENNFLEGNGGAGIRFLNGTGHAYRGNFLRGNTGGDVVDQFGNTDAGSNIK